MSSAARTTGRPVQSPNHPQGSQGPASSSRPSTGRTLPNNEQLQQQIQRIISNLSNARLREATTSESNQFVQRLQNFRGNFSEALVETATLNFRVNNYILQALFKVRGDFQDKASLYTLIPARENNPFVVNTYLNQASNPTNVKDAEKNRRFALIEKNFKDAKRLGLTNIVTYNTFIKLAGQYGRFDAAVEAFNELYPIDQSSELEATDRTYNAFIESANLEGAQVPDDAKKKRFPHVETAFETAKTSGNADIITYSTFIKIAGQYGRFDLAVSACNEIQGGLRDIDPKECARLFNTFIEAADLDGTEISDAEKKARFSIVEGTFIKAKELGFANTISYNVFFKIAGQYGRLDKALSAFDEMAPHNPGGTVLTEARTYQTLMEAATIDGAALGDDEKQSLFPNIERVLEESKKNHFDETFTYNIFLKVAGQYGRFDLALKEFGKMGPHNPNGKVQADSRTYVAFILSGDPSALSLTAEEKARRFSFIEKAFLESRKHELNDAVTCNAFIKIAGLYGRFDLALRVFGEMAPHNPNGKLHSSERTYQAFIEAAHLDGTTLTAQQQKERFAYVEKAFAAAKKHGFASSITCATYIKIAKQYGKFDLALAAVGPLDQDQTPGVNRDGTYNAVLKAGDLDGTTLAPEEKAVRFSQLEKVFVEARNSGAASTITYTTFIKIARQYGRFDLALRAFGEMSPHNPNGKVKADAQTYNTFLDAGDLEGADLSSDEKVKRFSILEKAFAEAKKGFANAITYTTFLKIAGQYGRFDVAMKALNEMLPFDPNAAVHAENRTYNAFFEAADIEGIKITDEEKEKRFPLVGKAFIQARDHGKADIYTYNCYIRIAGQYGRFELALAAYHEMLPHNPKGKVQANGVTYSVLLEAADLAEIPLEIETKRVRFSHIENAFKAAKDRGFANTINTSTFIKVAGHYGRFDLALETFNQMRPRNPNGLIEADKKTYLAIIEAASLEGIALSASEQSARFALIEKAFAEAKSLGYADHITCNAFIKVAGQYGRLDLALATFAKERGQLDDIGYHVMIDGLFKSGTPKDLQNANELLKQRNLLPPLKIQDGYVSIDLHGYSHGSGILAMYEVFRTTPSIKELQVITGRGSEQRGNYLTFREEMGRYIEARSKNYSCSLHPSNQGVLIVRRAGA